MSDEQVNDKMKSKPYGIFALANENLVEKSSVIHSLERLLIHIEEGRHGHEEVDSSQPLDVKQEGGNGVPPTLKSVGIPPKIL